MGWIRALLGRRRMDAAMEEEFHAHVEMQTEENRRAGMGEEEARRAAEACFGRMDSIRERCRDENGVGFAEALWSDVRFAVRLMRKSPGFTAVAVLTLALCTGAASAVYSVVDGVLLRPVALPDSGRLVYIWENDRLRKSAKEAASLPDFLDIQKQAQSYEALGAFQRLNLTLTGRGEPERVVAARVSHGYFQVLGVVPVAGRFFNESEEKAANGVLLSYRLWQRLFGRDPGALGRAVTLDGKMYTVAGVLPQAAASALGPAHREELWIPMAPERNDFFRGRHDTRILGRLKAGVRMEEAQEELQVLMSGLEKAYPVDNKGRSGYVIAVSEEISAEVKRPLQVLLGAALLLLLAGCANVANLLLARAFAREHEMTVRTFLGAPGRRLVRQLATENLVLALMGGALGWVVVEWGTKALLTMAPQSLPRLDEVHADWRVFAFTLLVVLLSWMVFGLVPAWRAADPGQARAGRGNTARVHQFLIPAEVAVTMVLVVSTGLLARSFYRLIGVDLQFQTARVHTITAELPVSRYPQPRVWPVVEWPAVVAFGDRVVEELRQTPEVESVALAGNSMARGAWTTRVTVDGRPEVAPGEQDEAEFRLVGPGYFETVGVAVEQGRVFSDSDDSKHPLVAIVNHAFLVRHFGGEEPMGRRIVIFGRKHEIVGLVADARYEGAGREVAPAMYVPYRQLPLSALTFVVKTRVPVTDLRQVMERAIHKADQAVAGFDYYPLPEVYAASLGLRRFTLLLIGVFAGLSMVLAAVGVYATVNFTLTRKTRETGIRLALGATRGQILREALEGALARVGFGCAVGLGGAAAAGWGLRSLLYEVVPWDPLTYAGVIAVLMSTAAVAAWVPARRACRVDPVVALRYE